MKLKEKNYTLKVPREKIEEELFKIEETTKPSNKCKHSRSIQHNLQEEDSDMPLSSIENDPYKKKMHQCIFCTHNIPLDYKNTQLLSQFVSPHTGLVYSQEVTGLCIYKYKELEETVFRARKLGLMPFFYKETMFVSDPEVFDPYKNNLKQIPNNYDKRILNAESTPQNTNNKKA
jgi:small subunit ribosomal protein S18